MFPLELKPKTIKFPFTNTHNIVIVTGNNLRHRRFAYRLLKEFGKLVIAWYELDPIIQPQKNKQVRENETSKTNKAIEINRRIISHITTHGILESLIKPIKDIKTWYQIRNYYKSPAKTEQKLFQREIEELMPYAHIQPHRINPSFVHGNDFIHQIKKIDPYFFLTLGGPLYKKELLHSIRGVSINQHAGHSPDLKGSQTIEWALYHRSLKHVSSTVHITVTGADAGPILRRSSPCVFYNDDVPTINARVVALGTELMIEVVQHIIKNKNITCFEQPKYIGKTYLSKEFNRDIITFIQSDFNNDWLKKALNKQRNF